MLYNLNYNIPDNTKECLGVFVDEKGNILFNAENILSSYNKKELQKIKKIIASIKANGLLKVGHCFTYPFIKSRLLIIPVKNSEDRAGFEKCKSFIEKHAEFLEINSLKISNGANFLL